jgi:RNA-directed DNA polymerase
MESPVHRKGARRVRASGWGISTGGKPSASASSNWHIITGATKELLEQQVKPVVERFLAERGLQLSTEKTTITPIEEGIDFLGHHIRKYNGKLLIKPSKKGVKTLLKKIRGIIKANPTTPAGDLIGYLNPLIEGWTNYYRHVVSSKTFAAIDRAIFESLWSWAIRRHPHKGKRWIKRKYFATVGNDHWVFQGHSVDKEGVRHLKCLRKADHVPIRRHVKIQSKANPYDPQWEAYFEQRQDRAMQATLKGRRALLSLWKRQQGRCPVCHQKITVETGWHSHHVTWKVHGGSDGTDNRVLLHPNCHQQVHWLASKGCCRVFPSEGVTKA